MILNSEDILGEIDETLDQLIQNAEVLKQISFNPEYKEEKEALKKTQDSLLAHLIHMDCLLEREKISQKKRKKAASVISEKLAYAGYFDQEFIQKIHDNFLKPISSQERKKIKSPKDLKPQVGKRRKKELLT